MQYNFTVALKEVIWYRTEVVNYHVIYGWLYLHVHSESRSIDVGEDRKCRYMRTLYMVDNTLLRSPEPNLNSEDNSKL